MHQNRWNKVILHVYNIWCLTRFCTWAFAFSYKAYINDTTQSSSCITITSYQICEKNYIKYLGIILENQLNWKPYIAKLTTQISKSCGILSNLWFYTTQPVSNAVYNVLIHPASKTAIQPLVNLQNKAVKFLKTSNKA